MPAIVLYGLTGEKRCVVGDYCTWKQTLDCEQNCNRRKHNVEKEIQVKETMTSKTIYEFLADVLQESCNQPDLELI